MIYGNTGAGLVDVDVPQSPLYQQALPNLRDVSAAAWGLPSLDDISVPDVTTEKDIQTDTDLTQKYFDLATKLKEYAVKGRSVGIDVTKPKNNPTHLQFSQEWNKMYQEFLQTGKELKRGKENIAQLNKFQLNPNSIVGSVPQGQVMTDETLSKYSMESPFADIKPVIKGYQSLRIYDQPSYDKFMAKWKADIAQVDNEAEMYKAQKPELSNLIEAKAEEAKMAMFPPNVDPRFYAKLEQDMAIHKNQMANKWANTGIAREGLEFRKSQQEVARGQFAEKVQYLMNNGGTTENAFGKLEADGFGKVQFIPRKVVAKKASEIKSNLQVAGGTPNPNDVLFIVQEEGGIKTYNMSNPQQQQQFALDYEAGNAFLENQLKQQQGIFDFSVNPDDNLYNVEPLFDATQVGKNKTNTQSEKATSSTTKKTNTAKTYTIINPQNGKVIASGVSKQDADKAIAKGYKVK